MNLNTKTVAILSVAFVLIVGLFWFVSSTLFLNDYASLERHLFNEDMERIGNFILSEIDNLEYITTDWAQWNDSYEYVAGNEPEFIESNVAETTFNELRLDALIFFNTSGSVVWGGAFDLEKKMDAPLPEGLVKSEIMKADSLLAPHITDGTAGIILLPGGPFMFSMEPILTSDGEGPSRGALLMGRFLDREELKSFSEILRFPLSAWRLDRPGIPEHLEYIRGETEEETFLVNTGPETMTGAITFMDITGKHSLLVSTEFHREIYLQGKASLSYFLIRATMAGMIASVLVLLFLRLLVLKPLGKLDRRVRHISESGNIAERVKVTGRDEIASLSGSINEMLISLEDAQLELRKLSQAVEHSSSSVLITNAEGNIEYTNPKFTQLTGYTSEEVKGKNPRIIKSEVTLPEVHKDLWETITSGREWRGEFTNRKKSGELYHELVSIAPVTGAEGNITHYIAVKEDITERKRAEDALKSAHDELEEKVQERTRDLAMALKRAEVASKAKSDFLNSMSHELRTPLNAIIGFSEILNDPHFGELNEKQADYVGDIHTSGNHLLSIVNDILDMSRADAGEVEYSPGPVGVGMLIGDSLLMVQETCLKHNISLDSRLGEGVNDLIIEGDEGKLRQVMFNLITNAAKFTPDGGNISVEADLRDDELTVSVIDTGVGIAAEDLDRIFDEFVQVKGGIRDKTPGTGLGLSLVRRIIGLHGGEIWVESDGEGKSATFTFTIPVKVKIEN